MARFVITGPSGWIGQALLALLAEELGDRFGHDVLAFGSFARHLDVPGTSGLAVRSLEDMTGADLAGAHLVHLAYLTREKSDVLGEREYTAQNIAIDDHVLRAAAEGPPRSIFVASSGAAAKATTDPALNPYGLCKLRQEQRFIALGKQLGVPVLAGRVFNIAGPYINKQQSYAVSNMLLQAEQTGVIRIAADIPVYRSFLHVIDLSRIILASSRQLHGEAGPVDLCGAEVLEMADIAAQAAHAVGGEIRIERPAINGSGSNSYLGDFTQTRGLALKLGLPIRPFSLQLDETWAWIRVLAVDGGAGREMVQSGP